MFSSKSLNDSDYDPGVESPLTSVVLTSVVESGSRLRLGIGIATCGRPDILRVALTSLTQQTRPPDRIIVCPSHASDLDPQGYDETGCTIEVVYGAQGTCSQRNAIIEVANDIDVLIFSDDDFIMDPSFLAEAEKLFEKFDDVVIATGLVLGDGATNAGISLTEASRLLAAPPPLQSTIQPVSNAYGCNMAVRLAIVRAQNIRFDEALPLYGWLEDLDFSRCLAPFGQVVKASALRGVHLGTKLGRTSGIKFGYSQIANPVYMARKRSMPKIMALQQITRNVAMNIFKFWSPEPWVDRRGRLRGNAAALLDLCRGQLSPGRILELS